MTEREALKLALEALELEDMACRYEKDPTPKHIAKAMTAVKEALAQPEQEPQYAGTARELFTNAAIERLDVRPSTKVYLGTPSVCEQHQDWCASLTQMLTSMPPKPAPCNCKPAPVIDKSAAIRIATSLGWEPKRTWVGLTQEDIDIAFDETQEGGGFWEFADAIEAKLKEKNT